MAKKISGLQIEIGADSSGLKRELGNVKTAIEKGFDSKPLVMFENFMNKLGESTRNVVTSAIGMNFGTILGKGLDSLQNSVDVAMKFESAMADVRKVVDFDTPQQFKEMEKDIISLSTKIPMTAEAISQIVAAGGQSGIAREDLMLFAESAAKMGIAFDISAEQAGQAMAELRTALGMSQKEVNDLGDVINYLGNTSAASSDKILEFTQRVAATAKVAGVSADSVAAIGSVLIGSGMSVERAGTGMEHLVKALTSGASATASTRKAFESLGLDAQQMANLMQTDANQAILTLLDSIKKLPKELQLPTITNLVGDTGKNSVAMLVNNLDLLESTLNNVGDSMKTAGSMEAEFTARIDTAENATQLFENGIDALSISLGQSLLPMMKDTAKTIIPLVANTAEWISENQALVETIVKLGTALATIKTLQSAGSFIQGFINAAREAAMMQTTVITAEQEKQTLAYQRDLAKREAALEKSKQRELNLIQRRATTERMTVAETTRFIAAETEKVLLKYNQLSAAMTQGMAKAYTTVSNAAVVSGEKMIASQTSVQVATAKTTGVIEAQAVAHTASGNAAAIAGEKMVAAQVAAQGATVKTTAAVTALTGAHVTSGNAAVVAGEKTVASMTVATGAVRTALSAVWALAGGWLGVAAAIAYATYALVDYYNTQAQQKKANTYSYNGTKYTYDEKAGGWYTDTTTKQMDTTAKYSAYGMGGGQAAGVANAMSTMFATSGKKNKVTDHTTLHELNAMKAQKEGQNKKDAEADLNAKLKEMQAGLNQSMNLPEVSMPVGGGGSIGGGGGSVGRSKQQEAEDLSRKLAEAQRNAQSLHDTMKEAIASHSDTSYATELARNAKDIAEKQKQIAKLQEDGLDNDTVENLKKELVEYASVIDENVKKKWREAYEDMVESSRSAIAESLHDFEGMAEAEYKTTLTKLERERTAKEKELMKDKDDWETKTKIADWYYAKVKKAEEDLAKARREAHKKQIQYLQEEGQVLQLYQYLNSSEGRNNERGALKLEGQQQLAKAYTEIWQEANKDISAHIAEASTSLYSSLSSSLTDFIKGAKSAKDVIKDFGNSILNMMAQIAAKKLASQWIESLLGSFIGGGSSGGASSKYSFSYGGLGSLSGYRFASGGAVRGIGTGTSDSIPAMLSNGEYVLNAAAVSKLGVPFLDKLNASGSLSAFAKGGYVTAPSIGGSTGGSGMSYASGRTGGSGVVVNITNKSDSDVKVESSSYDEGLDSYILNVVVDGASRNKGGFGKNLKTALGAQ